MESNINCSAPQRLPVSAQHITESIKFKDLSRGDHRLWPVVTAQRELLSHSLQIESFAPSVSHYLDLVATLRDSTSSALEHCLMDVIKARSPQLLYKDHLNIYIVIKPKKLASFTARVAEIITR